MVSFKNRRGKLVLFALSLFVICLAGLEIYLRNTQTPRVSAGYTRTHPIRRYDLRPNFTGKTYGAIFKTNSYGLRDLERTISRGDTAFRIAVFGDSITMGVGVALEQTFVKVLERKLNEASPIPVQVFNFGISGYNTADEYLYLTESYDLFKPHLVIFEFTASNDTIIGVHPPGSLKGINKNPFVRAVKDRLRYSYSYQWLAERYYLVCYRLRYGLGFKSTTKSELNARTIHEEQYYKEDYPGWVQTQEVFGDISRFCQQKGVPVIFLIQANAIHLATSAQEDILYPIVEKVTTALKANGIEHILVLDDVLRQYAGKEKALWVQPNDSHLSPVAHQLVGSALYQYLQQYPTVRKPEQVPS